MKPGLGDHPIPRTNRSETAERPTLLYVLHSGNLYGTERMALTTIDALGNAIRPILLAPEGPVIRAARNQGIDARVFTSPASLARAMASVLSRTRELSFAATGVSHSLLFLSLNAVFRRPVRHLHLVHGGTDERMSYGRKRLLNPFDIYQIAVSSFVRDRLMAHGVKESRIRVLENFLPDASIATTPKRVPFGAEQIRKVIIISRVDPIKRVDVLLDCLDTHPELGSLDFTLYGTGWDFESLRARAAARHPNVRFEGFSNQIPDRLAESDLLLHLCPEEPFGLVILEAMAAGVPVLVPNTGGAAEVIEPGVSGFHFEANQPQSLAAALHALASQPGKQLNAIVRHATARLQQRYSASAGAIPYKTLMGVSR